MSADRHFYCCHTAQHSAAVIANNNNNLDPRLESGVKVYPDVLFSAFLFVILLFFVIPKGVSCHRYIASFCLQTIEL